METIFLRLWYGGLDLKIREHVVKEVYPDSIAEEMGIMPGDMLLKINDNEIEDVFDYRYLIKDEYVEVLILSLIHI